MAFLSVRSSEEDGMPHLGLTRPLGEFYLAHELRDKPRGRVLVLHSLIERLLVGTQRLHHLIERLQRGLVESGADMPSIDPAFLCLMANSKYQRAKELARPTWFSVTDDDYLVLMHGLELQPLARSLARVVETRSAFGDYAFFVGSLRLGELALTELGDVLAVAKQGIARQQSF